MGGTNGCGAALGACGRGVSGAFVGGIVIRGMGAGADLCVGRVMGGVETAGAGLGIGGIAGFGELS